MKRVLLLLGALIGASAAGWAAFAKFQGDSHLTYEGDSLSGLTGDGRTFHGEITVMNRGQQGGVLHKFFGRVVDGPPGRVLVTRKGSKPPERGWWVSNVMKQGDLCVAEVDVELDEPATGPVVIELDAHEIGRRLVVHRTLRVTLPATAGSAQPAV
ncbi:MAG: hypothetical protein LC733_11085 [Actinobacteria bacterium]|nr:hypothetical protein [Actinomycetota bacterium]